MNGKRSVRRSPDQRKQVFQDNSDVCDDRPSGSSGSGGIPTKSWYLRNSTGNYSKNSMTSSSQMTVDDEEGQDGGHSSDRCPTAFTREVIARETSSSTLLSRSSIASQKSVLKTICNIPCLMLMVIFCIPKYLLQTFICTKDQFTMANFIKISRFLIIAVPVICGCIYCYCQYLKLTDVLSSQELALQYESELKSLWKSQNGLQEQIQEISIIKNQTAHLQAEMKRIQKGIPNSVKQILKESDIPGENKDQVLEMINQAFKKTYEDHVQMPDWAQKTIGATIDHSRTSKSYEPENPKSCWYKYLFISTAKPPDTILQPDVYPGNCWAFHGSEGQVVIKLPERIYPTAVTVQHIPKAVSPVKGATSALKDFSVYGIDDEINEETLLGTFMYDIEKETIQTFQLQKEAVKQFLCIKFKVQSNWGNEEFTCIYRVRVHGNMPEYSVPSKEGQK
ncbi:SUN domain-containing protein 3-like [Anolis sagrei]|uniref:SUN domain-containing protein 3-like n=1 Tax=Anolis sagrei TaxID=38937 RepID=UPI00352049E2